jgi:hypothetical protein
LKYFRETQTLLGENWPLLDYSIGDCFSRMEILDSAGYYFNKAADADPFAWEPRIRLMREFSSRGDSVTTQQIGFELISKQPWLFDQSYQSPYPELTRGLPESD